MAGFTAKISNISKSIKSLSLEELQTERRRLAKRANQRFVRLERAESKLTGEGYSTYGAYPIAQHYLGKKTRFNETLGHLKQDRNALIREINVLETFLNSKSSTVGGQKQIERTRIETFESGHWGERYRAGGKEAPKIKFAGNKEFYDFLNSETFKALKSSGFTSSQIIDIYDQARMRDPTHDEEEVLRKFEEALEDYRQGQQAALKDLIGRFNLKKLR